MGGPHPSMDSVNIFKNCPNLDIIVIGEGEATIVDLLDVLAEEGDLSTVKGISFRKNGKVIHNPPRPLISARVLARPDRVDSRPLPHGAVASWAAPGASLWVLRRP